MIEENESAKKEPVNVTEKNDDDDDDEEEGEEAWLKLGLHEALVKACINLGWTKPTAIQRAAIPVAMSGRDVIGLAETGSGKTGAFALPILHRLLDAPKRLYALILAPTRELAYQIHESFEALGAGIGLRACCIVGGVDLVQQAVALAKLPHVVIATPGRLVDHLQNTKGFSLKSTRCIVMDEADRMLSLDFEQELTTILEALPNDDDEFNDNNKNRLAMLFSATMTSKVAKLQRASLRNPAQIQVNKKFATPKKLVQQYLFIPAKFKECYLAALLLDQQSTSTLVFCATCSGATKLALFLRNLGIKATCLHGQMSQPKRLAALNKFKAHRDNVATSNASNDDASNDDDDNNPFDKRGCCVLVATDVASRGLDIPSVDLVLNFDLPAHGKEYVHRVGRTARAGRQGRAIAFVTQYDIELYQRLEHLIGTKLPACPIDEDRALVHIDKVNEASRLATIQLRDLQEKQLRGKRTKRKSIGIEDYDDDEEGAREDQAQANIFGKSSSRKSKTTKKKKKRF
uniref:RNA helicase n=1 Tax=Aureoumbra lagunensis TaxID=44058 RepID=A0A7S3NKR6_9STRA